MLIVLVILCILATIVSYISYERDYNGCCLTSAIGAILIGIVALLVSWSCIESGFDMLVIDDKIKLYQEENKNIEEEITTIVNNYQGFEKDVIKNVGDMETFFIKIPELKSNELTNKQMDVYINNNAKIKELKERKIDTKIIKWLLYFGG